MGCGYFLYGYGDGYGDGYGYGYGYGYAFSCGYGYLLNLIFSLESIDASLGF